MHSSLIFTPIMNQLTLGLVDEDEEVQEVTNRDYWEHRGTKETVAMADQILDMIHKFDPQLELKYNKFYIGLAKNDQPNNFVRARHEAGKLDSRRDGLRQSLGKIPNPVVEVRSAKADGFRNGASPPSV